MTRAVGFAVAPEVAYDYLVDPANRPAWQQSLRAVADVVGPDDVVGQTWTDLTWPGLAPRMELTEADRPRRWSEHGTWRGIEADLTLDFAPTASGCDVTPTMSLRGSGLLRPAAAVAGRLAPAAVRADLRRAARILAAGS